MKQKSKQTDKEFEKLTKKCPSLEEDFKKLKKVLL